MNPRQALAEWLDQRAAKAPAKTAAPVRLEEIVVKAAPRPAPQPAPEAEPQMEEIAPAPAPDPWLWFEWLNRRPCLTRVRD